VNDRQTAVIATLGLCWRRLPNLAVYLASDEAASMTCRCIALDAAFVVAENPVHR